MSQKVILDQGGRRHLCIIYRCEFPQIVRDLGSAFGLTDEGDITVRANQEEGIRCEAVAFPAVFVRDSQIRPSATARRGAQYLIPGSKGIDFCCVFNVGRSLGSEFQESEVRAAEKIKQADLFP